MAFGVKALGSQYLEDSMGVGEPPGCDWHIGASSSPSGA